MPRYNQPCRAYQSSYQYCESGVKPGASIDCHSNPEYICKQCSNRECMHADFEINICHPRCNNSDKTTKQKNSQYLVTYLVFRNIPCPEVKNHRNGIWDNPFLLGFEKDRLNEFQSPEKNHCESRYQCGINQNGKKFENS